MRGEDIRTPDQRLRVFVSSTLGELADERRSVSRAITALRLTSVMFAAGLTRPPLTSRTLDFPAAEVCPSVLDSPTPQEYRP